MDNDSTPQKYDPINDPKRDNQTLPTYENSKFNKDIVITRSPFVGHSLPEIEIFSHEHFNLLPTEKPAVGAYANETMSSLRTTLDVNLAGHPLDEKVSSIIVYSGYWRLYNKAGNTLSVILGPGHYEQVSEILIINDSISRIQPVSMGA